MQLVFVLKYTVCVAGSALLSLSQSGARAIAGEVRGMRRVVGWVRIALEGLIGGDEAVGGDHGFGWRVVATVI